VNIFWGNSGSSDFIHKLINQKFEAFSYWILNIMEQNKTILDSILPDLKNVLRSFLVNQFKDEATVSTTYFL